MTQNTKSGLLKVSTWFIRILLYLSWLALAVLFALVIFKAFNWPIGDWIKLDVPLSLKLTQALSLQEGGTVTKGELSSNAFMLDLPIDKLSKSFSIALLISTMLWFVGLNRLMYYLNMLFKNVSANGAFADGNAECVKVSGAIMMILAVYEACYRYFWGKKFLALADGSRWTELSFDLEIISLLPGLLILALGAVFEYGNSMQKEQDLTV